MTLENRKNSLIILGQRLKDLDDAQFLIASQKARYENAWFTQENILQALTTIRDQYLTLQALDQLVRNYKLDDHIHPKKVGLILAGNIPMVGMHDIICCFLTGHISLIKYSDKDKVLPQFLINHLIAIDREASGYLIEVEKLTDYDAVITTGSNTSAQHFEYYFNHVPNIIRKNRNAIAVLSGNETNDQLIALGHDVFSYFGLGCRNVSKIMVPDGYDITRLFEVFEPYKSIINHHKYKNNYDYNVALLLLTQEPFLQNEFLILKESEQIISRIASLHYQFYSNDDSLAIWLQEHKTEIQCVVSHTEIAGVKTIPFGKAQSPSILSYADGVDTMQFLLGI